MLVATILQSLHARGVQWKRGLVWPGVTNLIRPASDYSIIIPW